MSESLTTARLLGEAAEHRVAAEILLKGMNVFFPALDEGVDLITDKGVRIQVKASGQEYSNTRGYTYPAYLFCTRRKKYINSRDKTVRPKLDVSKIDFLICWCVQHDWFFVIPASEVTQTMVNIGIGTVEDGSSKYSEYLNNWELLRR